MIVREDEPIRIYSTKPRDALEPRLHRGGTKGRRSSALKAEERAKNEDIKSLLRINKLVAKETASTFYGVNTFEFDNMACLNLFVGRIGGNAKRLCHVAIHTTGYTKTQARPAFAKLAAQSRDLRSITFQHATLCPKAIHSSTGFTSVPEMVKDLTTLLKTMMKTWTANKQVGAEKAKERVLELIKIEAPGTQCSACKVGGPCPRARVYGCDTACGKMEEHCEEMVEEVREMVGKVLGF
jgi:hypothetical protein